MTIEHLSLIYRRQFGPRGAWEIAVSIRLPDSKPDTQRLEDVIRGICDRFRLDLETAVVRTARVSV